MLYFLTSGAQAGAVQRIWIYCSVPGELLVHFGQSQKNFPKHQLLASPERAAGTRSLWAVGMSSASCSLDSAPATGTLLQRACETSLDPFTCVHPHFLPELEQIQHGEALGPLESLGKSGTELESAMPSHKPSQMMREHFCDSQPACG